MPPLITPRTLKGFRDFLPQQMLAKEQLLEKVRQVYRSYGFAPIDTPALEYAEILLGKGGEESDKQLYRFRDAGGREVALRFDLTVPFARFAAQHLEELPRPFKRYHIGPVWRGENPQHGRYREFWQCDFDTLGTQSNAADIEIVFVIYDLLTALGFRRFRIQVNNRLILTGLLEQLGLAERTRPILVALDKLPKIGREAVQAEIEQKAGLTADQAQQVLALAQRQGSWEEILDSLQRDFANNVCLAEGVRRLRELFTVCRAAGLPAECLHLDLAIARGLDYYTGTVYETFLEDKRDIGSICSGGRYDNLAGLYTTQSLPGVGASLGVDRLLAAMEELHLLPAGSTPAPVLVVQFDAERLADYHRLARELRAAGIGAEVFPEAKRIGQQLQYAERRGCRVAVIAGSEEFAQGTCKVKDLARRQEVTVPQREVVAAVQQVLTGAPATVSS
jgi:histidyl-tRNA synthetase